jgi:hypothetical protein
MNDLLKFLKPKKTNSTKVRVGDAHDGGYVVPELALRKCESLFTYGVGPTFEFEKQFAEKYKKAVHMYDHTLGKESYSDGLINFYNEGLGFEKNCRDFRDHYDEIQKNGYVFLKIDIEGGEFDFFEKADIDFLMSKSNALCLEFHYIEHAQNMSGFCKIMEKINANFSLVHIHGNNNAGVFRYKDHLIPTVLEMSFLNKKLINLEYQDDDDYPIMFLDSPNTKDRDDIELKFTKND